MKIELEGVNSFYISGKDLLLALSFLSLDMDLNLKIKSLIRLCECFTLPNPKVFLVDEDTITSLSFNELFKL